MENKYLDFIPLIPRKTINGKEYILDPESGNWVCLDGMPVGRMMKGDDKNNDN